MARASKLGVAAPQVLKRSLFERPFKHLCLRALGFAADFTQWPRASHLNSIPPLL